MKQKTRIHTHGSTICFDSGMRIFHFNILVPHQSPCSETGPIKLRRSSEVFDGFLMIRPQGVVISWWWDSVKSCNRSRRLGLYQWDNTLLGGLCPWPENHVPVLKASAVRLKHRECLNKYRCRQAGLGWWRGFSRTELLLVKILYGTSMSTIRSKKKSKLAVLMVKDTSSLTHYPQAVRKEIWA